MASMMASRYTQCARTDTPRAFAAWQLEEAGFEVLQAANANEALRAMKSRPDVRVLFTDVQMPGRLDGMDLARKIHEQWPKVLLLITSGNGQPAKADIPNHGHFLAKPYRSEDVISEIAALALEAATRGSHPAFNTAAGA